MFKMKGFQNLFKISGTAEGRKVMNFHFLFKPNNQKDKICNYSDNMKVLKCMNDLSLDMHSIHLGSFKKKKRT